MADLFISTLNRFNGGILHGLVVDVELWFGYFTNELFTCRKVFVNIKAYGYIAYVSCYI